MADELTEATRLLEGVLHKRRADLVRQIERVDQALASMATVRAIAGEEAGSPFSDVIPDESAPSESPTLRATGPSVYQAAVTVAEEADRDWGADDLVEEFKARGITFEVADLQNSLFSALSRASRNGT
ncbi:MAG: hypothetical protein ACRDYY_06895, partial [Acidimicrobiales bacterium]